MRFFDYIFALKKLFCIETIGKPYDCCVFSNNGILVPLFYYFYAFSSFILDTEYI